MQKKRGDGSEKGQNGTAPLNIHFLNPVEFEDICFFVEKPQNKSIFQQFSNYNM